MVASIKFLPVIFPVASHHDSRQHRQQHSGFQPPAFDMNFGFGTDLLSKMFCPFM